MAPTTGHHATGAVSFSKVDGGVRVVAVFVGVSEGTHGFHVHERGDCSRGDGTSAGDHWNPEGVAHGGRLSAVRHVGDLGNVTADADGVVRVDFLDRVIRLDGANSIVGRGFILRTLVVRSPQGELLIEPS